MTKCLLSSFIRSLAFLALGASMAVAHEPLPAASTQLWGGLRPGPYQVTFSMLRIEDPSRSFGASARRPIDVSMWQPLQVGTGPFPALPLASYVIAYMAAPLADARAQVDPRPAMNRFRKEWFPIATTAAVNQLLESRCFASRDTPPAAGKFPLIIYAPGYQETPLSHIATAEFLASHGYVVVMSPSQGESPIGMTFDAAGQEQQIRDIEFMAGALRTRPNVDPEKVVLVGSGFGGGAALVAAMRARGIAGLAILDGATTFDQTSAFLRSAPAYDPAALRVPMLVLKTESPQEKLELVRGLGFSDRRVVRFHGKGEEFLASSVLQAKVAGDANKTTFGSANNTLLRFLEENIKETSPSSKPFLSKEESKDKPAGEASSELLLPKIDAPGRRALVEGVLDRSDVDSLVNAQQSVSKKVPGLSLLTAGTLHMLAMNLKDRGETDKAIQIYQLLTTTYPRDCLAFNRLGDLYREKKEIAKAKRLYRQSLAIESDNQEALAGLAQVAAN